MGCGSDLQRDGDVVAPRARRDVEEERRGTAKVMATTATSGTASYDGAVEGARRPWRLSPTSSSSTLRCEKKIGTGITRCARTRQKEREGDGVRGSLYWPEMAMNGDGCRDLRRGIDGASGHFRLGFQGENGEGRRGFKGEEPPP